MLGSCVKVAEGPRDEFAQFMLLSSLTNSWIGREEYTKCVHMCVDINHNNNIHVL